MNNKTGKALHWSPVEDDAAGFRHRREPDEPTRQ